MRIVSGWNDLESLGIVLLTGESCAHGYRILFDVTEAGNRALARLLGCPGLRLAEPWNRGSASDPHVGSVLLTREMFGLVAVFALLEAGFEAWRLKDCVVGFEEADSPEERERFLE